MLYELALQSGHPPWLLDPYSILESMTPRRVAAWRAFFSVRPRIEDRAEFYHRTYMTHFVAANSGKKSRKPKQRDFIIWKHPSEVVSSRVDSSTAEQRAAAFSQQTQRATIIASALASRSTAQSQ